MITRNTRGATLIEILIVSALLLVVLGGILSMGLTAATSYSLNGSKMMADDSASLALQRMSQEVRTGLRVTVDADAQGLTVVMPAVNGQGDYDRYYDGALVRYYLHAGRLYRKEGTAEATVVGRHVSAGRFTLDGTQLGIHLTCAQQIGNRKGSTTLATEITLRNQLL